MTDSKFHIFISFSISAFVFFEIVLVLNSLIMKL